MGFLSVDRPRLADLAGPPLCGGCRVRSEPLCPACRDDVARAITPPLPPGVARLLVPWRYDGPVRGLVLDLKLRGFRAAAVPLVDAMASLVYENGLRGSVLTWVPARRADIRRRGYDHAAVLAQGLGRTLGLEARPLLRRTGSAQDQAGLTAAQRRGNLERVFTAEKTMDSVVLVDDVITTGATLGACAKALLTAGAQGVEAVVASAA